MKLLPVLFLASPVILQIPYTLLTLRFDYPDVLRLPGGVILTRYFAAGPDLPLIWFAFACSLLPLLFAVAALPARLPGVPPAATPIGVASVVVQIIGLLRWTFAVPLLAAGFRNAPSDAHRAAIEWTFQMQHQLLGAMLGEHLGQLLLAAWTVSIALTRLPSRAHRPLGCAAAALFALSSLGALGTVIPVLAPLDALSGPAFLLWSVWCALLGWQLLRLPVLRRRAAEPAAHEAMQDARL
ncbi:MAG: hypothetical protein SFV54_23460 [Bryobacteraceae bacterium]|nr:hypothetical protein [Bryobacteraceae bacterium]